MQTAQGGSAVQVTQGAGAMAEVMIVPPAAVSPLSSGVVWPTLKNQQAMAFCLSTFSPSRLHKTTTRIL